MGILKNQNWQETDVPLLDVPATASHMYRNSEYRAHLSPDYGASFQTSASTELELDSSLDTTLRDIKSTGKEPISGYTRSKAGDSEERPPSAKTMEGRQKSPRWPEEPGSLGSMNGLKSAEIVGYVLLALCAMLFLAFALLAASVHNTFSGYNYRLGPGRPIILPADLAAIGDQVPLGTEAVAFPMPPNGPIQFVANRSNQTLNYQLFEAAKFGPTIFPILFSITIGAGLKVLARMKAESSSKIETLEMLVGSRSLASTITILVALREASTFGISLLLLWCLSPIAGQASLRILSTKEIADTSIGVDWSVANLTNFGLRDDDILYSDIAIKMDYLNFITKTSPTVYDGVGPNDIYGDPLPFASQMDANWTWNSHLVPPTDFISLWQNASINVSSLAGIPVYGPNYPYALPTDGGTEPTVLDTWDASNAFRNTANITFFASLMDFTCSSFSQYAVNDSWTDILGPKADPTLLRSRGDTGAGFFVDASSQEIRTPTDPQTILFGSFYLTNVTIWNCSARLNTREYSAQCFPGNNSAIVCAPLSVGPSVFSNQTPLNNLTFASIILDNWPIFDEATANSSSYTEQNIASVFWPPVYNLRYGLVDLSDIDNITFSDRLTTLFNTWYISIYGNLLGKQVLANTTSATPLYFNPFTIVVCNWIYFSIVSLASLLLIICALLSAWLRYKITTPNVLGYVSSMTIDNPYVSLRDISPGTGTTLSGLERTRLLKGTRLVLGDVQGDAQYGKVALASEGSGVVAVRRNRKFL